MQEEWMWWEPLLDLQTKYHIESTFTTIESFVIVLSYVYDLDKKVKIKFTSPLKVYRKTYETLRYKTIVELDEQHGMSFYGNWTFFKIINSSYLERMLGREYSYNSTRGTHYCLITLDYMIDMISDTEPIVQWLV